LNYWSWRRRYHPSDESGDGILELAVVLGLCIGGEGVR